MKRRGIVIACVLLAGMPFVLGCDRMDAWLHPDRCVLSQRPLRPGMAVQIEAEGGPSGDACCLRCVITHARQTGRTMRIVSVTDYGSHERIDPERAVYVVGSTVTPCAEAPVEVPPGRREAPMRNWDRCLPTVMAFAQREDAERFRQDKGGTILTFAELVKGTPVSAAE